MTRRSFLKKAKTVAIGGGVYFTGSKVGEYVGENAEKQEIEIARLFDTCEKFFSALKMANNNIYSLESRLNYATESSLLTVVADYGAFYSWFKSGGAKPIFIGDNTSEKLENEGLSLGIERTRDYLFENKEELLEICRTEENLEKPKESKKLNFSANSFEEVFRTAEKTVSDFQKLSEQFKKKIALYRVEKKVEV